MKLILNIGRVLLNFIYFFYKLFPTRKRIAFISRQSDTPSGGYKTFADRVKTTCA